MFYYLARKVTKKKTDTQGGGGFCLAETMGACIFQGFVVILQSLVRTRVKYHSVCNEAGE